MESKDKQPEEKKVDERAHKLVDALNIMNGISCTGRDDMNRMLSAMGIIEQVAHELITKG